MNCVKRQAQARSRSTKTKCSDWERKCCDALCTKIDRKRSLYIFSAYRRSVCECAAVRFGQFNTLCKGSTVRWMPKWTRYSHYNCVFDRILLFASIRSRIQCNTAHTHTIARVSHTYRIPVHVCSYATNDRSMGISHLCIGLVHIQLIRTYIPASCSFNLRTKWK